MAVVLAVLVLVGACRGPGAPDEAGPDQPDLRLVSALSPFAACDELADYLRTEGSRLVGAFGLGGEHLAHGMPMVALDSGAEIATRAAAPGGDAAPKAGTDYSQTNVQEAGVDEPDLVKTDGRRLVAFTQGRLRVVDLSGGDPRLAASLKIADEYQSGDLLLAGDRVLVLHHAAPARPGPPLPGAPEVQEDRSTVAPELHQPRAQVTVVDISQMGSPRVVSELQLDGSLAAARMVDGVARLVLRSGPPRIAFALPSGPDEVKAVEQANRRLVEESTVDHWLPTYSYSEPGRPEAAASGRLGECREVVRPGAFSGLGMVSVLTVDAADPRPGPAATVVGAAGIVYASGRNLYVTSMRWPDPPVPAEPGDAPTAQMPIRPPATSEIHKFDISDKVRTRYLASGSVPGQLLNQFSMSEHGDHLRVATTIHAFNPGGNAEDSSESQLSVLRQEGAALAVVGHVGGLGRGERIYSVRFLGDRGYVVTFRQIDPLYVVDLSDPQRPAVRGELKIPGYSAYLHPVGEHRLLGVGQEATDQGRVQGTQLSLFDVSDPASPRRLAQTVLPQAHSEAEFDHHAFLHWPRTGLTLIPIQSHGEPGVVEDDARVQRRQAPQLRAPWSGAVAFAVGEDEVTEIGRLQHRDGHSIRRSVVAGDRLITVSDVGLLTSDLDSLTERSWLGF